MRTMEAYSNGWLIQWAVSATVLLFCMLVAWYRQRRYSRLLLQQNQLLRQQIAALVPFDDIQSPEEMQPPHMVLKGTPVHAEIWRLRLHDTAMENLSSPQFSMDDLAEKMGVGRKVLFRLVRARTGMSPNQYVQNLRLTHARYLLESGSIATLRQVATAVGFRSVGYFSHLYRERFGHSPAMDIDKVQD